MPKRVKKPSADPNKRAHQLLTEHLERLETGRWAAADPTDIGAIISNHMRAIGSKGGKVSGAKRMQMPKKDRVAIAKKGAAARWGKKKQGA